MYLRMLRIFLTKERIVYFLNTVQCYTVLEIYCCYEIQKHKALCEFVVEKGLLLVERMLRILIL